MFFFLYRNKHTIKIHTFYTKKTHTHINIYTSVMALPNPPTFWRFDYRNGYVFGGMFLAILMLIIILSIAVCLEWRRRSSTSGGDRRVEIGVYSTKTARALHNGDDETNVSPKTVVIMAGDELPTYLATPAADTIDTSHECK